MAFNELISNEDLSVNPFQTQSLLPVHNSPHVMMISEGKVNLMSYDIQKVKGDLSSDIGKGQAGGKYFTGNVLCGVYAVCFLLPI